MASLGPNELIKEAQKTKHQTVSRTPHTKLKTPGYEHLAIQGKLDNEKQVSFWRTPSVMWLYTVDSRYLMPIKKKSQVLKYSWLPLSRANHESLFCEHKFSGTRDSENALWKWVWHDIQDTRDAYHLCW